MKARTIIITAVVTALVASSFAVKSYLYQREAMRAVVTVLNSWHDNTQNTTVEYWQNPKNSAPVYNLLSYSVVQSKFFNKNNKRTAHIVVTLEFDSNHVFPSNKNWLFELIYTRYGWQITEFQKTD